MKLAQNLLLAAGLTVTLPSLPVVLAMQQPSGGDRMAATMVGHQFRQDDLPAIAAAPDGSLWEAWLSFTGDRDDIAIRHYRNGKWQNLQWVPDTSGDSWLPQVGVDASNRVWVVWSQQVKSNWDLYARSFNPAKQEWGARERLTSDPLPDINPRLTSNAKGELALVWQGFRGKNSNIFLKTFDGRKWSADVRVTNRPANDWEPAVAMDSHGTIWVAYDSYKNGNYDVFVSKVHRGTLEGSEVAIAATLRHEARATVAVDSTGRVWVAWETGPTGWGKDYGYELRSLAPGVPLGVQHEPRIACFAGNQWRTPETPLASAFQGSTDRPHVFADGHGSVWVVAMELRGVAAGPRQSGRETYYEYWATHLTEKGWLPAFSLPRSRGRSSTRVNAALARDGSLWLTWPTDNRTDSFHHRPIRQEIYAARLPDAPVAGEPALKAYADEKVEAKVGHPHEAADVQAVRGYTALVGGKRMHIVRGDFHRHTELSWDGGGAYDGNLQDYYRYMIDVSLMDFGASTDHQGGAWPYWWWYTQKMTDMYHVPGAFVPIFGYERSALYPNGHRNVFFANRAESRVTPFNLKDGARDYSLPLKGEGDEPGIGAGDLVANDTKLLYEEMRPRRALTISHTSATRMGTDWRDNDPDLEPVVEIFQGARASSEAIGAPFAYDPKRDERLLSPTGLMAAGMVSNAWSKGYKLGIISSSDHGSTHISYAMVYTDNPTRQGVLDAIRKRHTYGAMDNIIMDVRLGGHFMGDAFALAGAAPMKIVVRGTRPVATLEVIKDGKIIYSAQPNQQNVDVEFTDKGGVSGRHYYYVRVQQDDKMLAWSSPMFINYE